MQEEIPPAIIRAKKGGILPPRNPKFEAKPEKQEQKTYFCLLITSRLPGFIFKILCNREVIVKLKMF
jgi:hypothetical protein